MPASLPLPRDRMPEGVDEYSDTNNAPDCVKKNKGRMVRDLNAACPLHRVGKQYDGNSEATKREQSESLHRARRPRYSSNANSEAYRTTPSSTGNPPGDNSTTWNASPPPYSSARPQSEAGWNPNRE